MKSLMKLVIEVGLVMIAMYYFFLLLTTSLSGEALRPPQPLSQQEVLMFYRECEGRVVMLNEYTIQCR